MIRLAQVMVHHLGGAADFQVVKEVGHLIHLVDLGAMISFDGC